MQNTFHRLTIHWRPLKRTTSSQDQFDRIKWVVRLNMLQLSCMINFYMSEINLHSFMLFIIPFVAAREIELFLNHLTYVVSVDSKVAWYWKKVPMQKWQWQNYSFPKNQSTTYIMYSVPSPWFILWTFIFLSCNLCTVQVEKLCKMYT